MTDEELDRQIQIHKLEYQALGKLAERKVQEQRQLAILRKRKGELLKYMEIKKLKRQEEKSDICRGDASRLSTATLSTATSTTTTKNDRSMSCNSVKIEDICYPSYSASDSPAANATTINSIASKTVSKTELGISGSHVLHDTCTTTSSSIQSDAMGGPSINVSTNSVSIPQPSLFSLKTEPGIDTADSLSSLKYPPVMDVKTETEKLAAAMAPELAGSKQGDIEGEESAVDHLNTIISGLKRTMKDRNVAQMQELSLNLNKSLSSALSSAIPKAAHQSLPDSVPLDMSLGSPMAKVARSSTGPYAKRDNAILEPPLVYREATQTNKILQQAHTQYPFQTVSHLLLPVDMKKHNANDAECNNTPTKLPTKEIHPSSNPLHPQYELLRSKLLSSDENTNRPKLSHSPTLAPPSEDSPTQNTDKRVAPRNKCPALLSKGSSAQQYRYPTLLVSAPTNPAHLTHWGPRLHAPLQNNGPKAFNEVGKQTEGPNSDSIINLTREIASSRVLGSRRGKYPPPQSLSSSSTSASVSRRDSAEEPSLVRTDMMQGDVIADNSNIHLYSRQSDPGVMRGLDESDVLPLTTFTGTMSSSVQSHYSDSVQGGSISNRSRSSPKCYSSSPKHSNSNTSPFANYCSTAGSQPPAYYAPAEPWRGPYPPPVPNSTAYGCGSSRDSGANPNGGFPPSNPEQPKMLDRHEGSTQLYVPHQITISGRQMIPDDRPGVSADSSSSSSVSPSSMPTANDTRHRNDHAIHNMPSAHISLQPHVLQPVQLPPTSLSYVTPTGAFMPTNIGRNKQISPSSQAPPPPPPHHNSLPHHPQPMHPTAGFYPPQKPIAVGSKPPKGTHPGAPPDSFRYPHSVPVSGSGCAPIPGPGSRPMHLSPNHHPPGPPIPHPHPHAGGGPPAPQPQTPQGDNGSSGAPASMHYHPPGPLPMPPSGHQYFGPPPMHSHPLPQHQYPVPVSGLPRPITAHSITGHVRSPTRYVIL